MARGNAQDDDAAGGGFAHGELHGATEGRLIGNGLIGGGDDENRVGTIFKCGQCGQGQRGGGVAADGLEQAGAERDAGLAQLFEGKEAVFFATDDVGVGDADVCGAHCGQTQGGLLEQAFVAGKAKELFGEPGPRQRPQPGAGPATEDDGLNGDFGRDVRWGA
jgi:hypothetical protein